MGDINYPPSTVPDHSKYILYQYLCTGASTVVLPFFIEHQCHEFC